MLYCPMKENGYHFRKEGIEHEIQTTGRMFPRDYI